MYEVPLDDLDLVFILGTYAIFNFYGSTLSSSGSNSSSDSAPSDNEGMEKVMAQAINLASDK
ncbi:hypothetical protein RO3G_01829 [Rhizopus delemar RA 99-880]|uniref:Uncharacterized protein n=1 Tax=Rhizopus delemar (strain RA 99-880 / ATCC MYA-4621 / FGSC 9543 / NRRL 43880) TaxID=246409 RepID=I1BLP5_RHIO9|nr:hypothetical protein RO3G_01829 [Rhizopus delemar RA 99-880]|eukprot:EIE77125.1 hypothetical protein RO3G_01829 [Rhizopus delemar RA 99-880]